MYNHISVKDFEISDRIHGVYLIKSIAVKITNSNNKKYLDLTLSDNTGDINSKLWEVRDGYENKFKENTLVLVKGIILNWQNNLQFKLEDITDEFNKDQVNITDYVQSAPLDSNIMFEELYNLVLSFENNDIKNILIEILDLKKEKLLYYPAAKKNHHSIKGGLIYHIISMIKLGESICNLYSGVNKELLFAGIILHDIEKTEEMDSSELGIVTSYTVEGQLLSHLIQGITLVGRVGDKVSASKEVIMLLQHMVLSHHYEAEYGSPIKPMIIEAELLHYIDVIDARMYDMTKVTCNLNKGEFSDRIFSLNNRKIYKPNI